MPLFGWMEEGGVDGEGHFFWGCIIMSALACRRLRSYLVAARALRLVAVQRCQECLWPKDGETQAAVFMNPSVERVPRHANEFRAVGTGFVQSSDAPQR